MSKAFLGIPSLLVNCFLEVICFPISTPANLEIHRSQDANYYFDFNFPSIHDYSRCNWTCLQYLCSTETVRGLRNLYWDGDSRMALRLEIDWSPSLRRVSKSSETGVL